ncbi:hypothetical protein IEQ34_004701 [Dendrobium chrysotoxum]|uniref:Uncharacterized protein n=1 Tax=Dendrobium chrysotoxum TaxID=161865 RepID=A0AAV7HJ57_DENCH|nr:hypothetical protein IEQ34_004701 [Dendrobium chrysotoxum]
MLGLKMADLSVNLVEKATDHDANERLLKVIKVDHDAHGKFINFDQPTNIGWSGLFSSKNQSDF